LQVNNETCFGSKDGSISVQGIGGVPPYTYLWADVNNATTPTVTGLAGGFNPKIAYIVVIKDLNGCAAQTTINLGSPDTLKAVLDYSLPNPSKPPSCDGYTDGVIKLLVTGGNAPYSFEWKNTNATNNIATKLSAGKYEVVITDQKGCSLKLEETLESPPPIKFTLDTILSPICFGYLTDVKIKTASGGAGSMLGNYTFTIDDGGDANAKDGVIPVYAGKHSVKVFDPDGCFVEQTIEIQDPPAIKVYLGPDVELELGDSYEINATIEANAPLVKYDWSPTIGLTFSDSCKNDCGRLIKPLEDGSFIHLVTDTIGCTGSDTINISIDRNRNVYLPNIFSPNVDGTNDFMEVYADPESVENINYFKIFDRWGNLVFESNSFKPSDSRGSGNRWDGFYQGIKANTGTYTYVCEVKFVDNVVLRFRGDVSLVR
jgi:gliding motility-associated-like protein